MGLPQKYQQVLQFDQFGVIGAMLEKENQTLKILKLEGNTQRSRKAQEYTSSLGYICTTSSQKVRWEAKKSNKPKKNVIWDMHWFKDPISFQWLKHRKGLTGP